MRKAIVLGLTVLCLAGLAGCTKKPGADEAGKSDLRFVSEDYKPGVGSMMVTDKGVYYHSGRTEPGFHYYDPVTGKAMYLCNKPECRHDGNEFCVATNARYEPLNCCIYSGKLFIYAVEETETQYLLKLLAAGLDGSELNEVATVMTLEKTGENININHCDMIIHRNTAVFEMNADGILGEDVSYYGVAFLNLDTKEVTYLDEEPFGKDNVEITGLSGYADWIYYCRKEGKKQLLHRYHIAEKTDEVCKLLTGFSGTYAVMDEDTVVYLRSSKIELCSYRYSTGENKEELRFKRTVDNYYTIDGERTHKENIQERSVSGLCTDGEYFYAPEPPRALGGVDENGNDVSRMEDACVYVLNRELEVIAIVDMADLIPIPGFEETEWYPWNYTTSLYYCGEDIYWELSPQDNTAELYIFHCNRSDFLAGKPKFTFVYRWEW